MNNIIYLITYNNEKFKTNSVDFISFIMLVLVRNLILDQFVLREKYVTELLQLNDLETNNENHEW